jgi:hypothetical protein
MVLDPFWIMLSFKDSKELKISVKGVLNSWDIGEEVHSCSLLSFSSSAIFLI